MKKKILPNTKPAVKKLALAAGFVFCPLAYVITILNPYDKSLFSNCFTYKVTVLNDGPKYSAYQQCNCI